MEMALLILAKPGGPFSAFSADFCFLTALKANVNAQLTEQAK